MAEVIDLNSRRKKTYEMMHCEFCHTEHAMVHIILGKQKESSHGPWHGPCPGCDEIASIPLRDWENRIIRL